MDAKPKHKNTPDTNTIEFVTTLNVDECIERLERGPARTLDHRLTVRTDGPRFVIDAQIESGDALMVVAELRGDLIQLQNKRTRVRATLIKKNPLDTARRWVIIPVMGSTGGLWVGIICAELWGVVVGIFSGALAVALLFLIFVTGMDWEVQKFDRKIPDLPAWLRHHLDA